MYDEKILLNMLDEAIGFMVEHESCRNCIYSGTADCRSNMLNNMCADGIFEGMYRKYKN